LRSAASASSPRSSARSSSPRRQPVDHGRALQGLIATGILSLIGVGAVINYLIGFGPLQGASYPITGLALFECGIVGLVVTGLIIWITEYYTGTNFRPVKSIAQSSSPVTAPT